MAQRDLIGYGGRWPSSPWPQGVRLPISLVINYEEGSERSLGAGDPDQETLTEWGSYNYPGNVRNLAMESMFEYGSRVGVWRILDVLKQAHVKATVFACAVALRENRIVTERMVSDGHEFCSHGHRWEEVFRLAKEDEAEHITHALDLIESVSGKRPRGWYCRYGPSENTRSLLAARNDIDYDSDSYSDDAPYVVSEYGKPQLVIPYAPDANDFMFWQGSGPFTAGDFLEYLKDTFDTLYEEAGEQTRMMSVGLHCRIIGRPGRIRALRDFINHVQKTAPDAAFVTRSQIAQWCFTAGLDHFQPNGPVSSKV